MFSNYFYILKAFAQKQISNSPSNFFLVMSKFYILHCTVIYYTLPEFFSLLPTSEERLAPSNRPGEEIFDPLRISPGQPSCIQWHSTSSLQQFLGRTDLYNPRYRNFGTDNLKQILIQNAQKGMFLL